MDTLVKNRKIWHILPWGMVIVLFFGGGISALTGLAPAGSRLAAGARSQAPTAMLQARAGGHLLGFLPAKAYLAMADHALSIDFLGTQGATPTHTAGADSQPAATRGAVRLGTVTYTDLWPGVTLQFAASSEGITESNYFLAPGASVGQIRLRYNVPVSQEADGGLRFTFSRGYMTESAPVAWQEISGRRVNVAARFTVSPEGEVGFTLGGYDPDYALLIDTLYVWHTFYGSDGVDHGNGIAVGSDGGIYITGASYADWKGPSLEEPKHSYSGSADIVVIKLNASGEYQWHTFYGSDSVDYARAIAVDENDNLFITGYSSDFRGPTGELPIHSTGADWCLFVLSLASNGDYRWHTSYGTGHEDFNAIDTDASGNVYVTGRSGASWNGDTGQLPKHAYNAGGDIAILKLSNLGAYQWHTFYGSSDYDHGDAIKVDGSGSYVYVLGIAAGSWGTPLNTFTGSDDYVVIKLDSDGNGVWHTYYGSDSLDIGQDLAVDKANNIYVSGLSDNSWGSPLHSFTGSYVNDISVFKLDSDGSLKWNTFYGSDANDAGGGLTIDPFGTVIVAGYSYKTWNGPSGQLPLHTFGGGQDISILAIGADGGYRWHTFYG